MPRLPWHRFQGEALTATSPSSNTLHTSSPCSAPYGQCTRQLHCVCMRISAQRTWLACRAAWRPSPAINGATHKAPLPISAAPRLAHLVSYSELLGVLNKYCERFGISQLQLRLLGSVVRQQY